MAIALRDAPRRGVDAAGQAADAAASGGRRAAAAALLRDVKAQRDQYNSGYHASYDPSKALVYVHAPQTADTFMLVAVRANARARKLTFVHLTNASGYAVRRGLCDVVPAIVMPQ